MTRPESPLSAVSQPDVIRTIGGPHYIAYARCASCDGAENSLNRQIRAIHRFAEGLSMRCAGEVRLAGVSGGPPALRTDLRKLLARKRMHNDYEVLIMEDFARLVRTQSLQDLAVEDEFAKCGVRIIYLRDYEQTTQDRTMP